MAQACFKCEMKIFEFSKATTQVCSKQDVQAWNNLDYDYDSNVERYILAIARLHCKKI